ncbi:signal peptidase [Elstera litoralis]|uniref:Signal peptidase I n=1 Tax=Elstera litoralis TaxID=552518 RepID=A0A0F3IUV1_9PROT|nr:signal peptidase I [Elstera litoralis]KJV10486.1 signal peptidase [Elstera litoralis]
MKLGVSNKATASKANSWWDVIRQVTIAIVIALGIRSFFAEPFNIPSGSMIPTLLVGDYVFVTKYSYGYSRHSFPLSPPIFSGRTSDTLPARGDVAVFKTPQDNKTDYIKRVVGLPGDRVQMREGRLYINDKLVDRRFVEDYVYRTESGYTIRTRRYEETLPGNRKHTIIEQSDAGPLDNTRVYEVPAGHLFMMGDNRDGSEDSRASVGFVPVENLVGKAQVIWLSVDGSLFRFWELPWTLRFNRIGQGLD